MNMRRGVFYSPSISSQMLRLTLYDIWLCVLFSPPTGDLMEEEISGKLAVSGVHVIAAILTGKLVLV